MIKTTLLSAVVCAALCFSSGCQSLVSTSAEPDPRLQQEEINVEGSSYATACVVGAGIGLLACAIAGSDDASCYALAAAGGCGVAMAGNALLDNLRKQYATQEDQLDALAAYISRNNEQASRLAEVATQVYKENHQRLAQMKKDIAAGVLQKKDIEYEIARYDANIKLLQENINGHTKALASYTEVRNGLSQDSQKKFTAAEKKQLAECDKKIAALQRDIENIRKLCAEFINDRDVLNLAASNYTGVHAS